jgi:HD-GYP domain-containing protein (c-di-GMP phosphodiesterase class II)
MIYEIINTDHKLADCLTELKSAHKHTACHSVQVGVLSGIIGAKLGFPEYELSELIKAGMLHDYGKIFIGNQILDKPGKLTSEEYDAIKKHSLIGYDKLKEKNCFSENILTAVLQHHEKLDGTGYPDGLTKGISLYAQIISIADIFDALTTDRPYRKKNTTKEAFKCIVDPEGRLDKRLTAFLIDYVRNHECPNKCIEFYGETAVNF